MNTIVRSFSRLQSLMKCLAVVAILPMLFQGCKSSEAPNDAEAKRLSQENMKSIQSEVNTAEKNSGATPAQNSVK